MVCDEPPVTYRRTPMTWEVPPARVVSAEAHRLVIDFDPDGPFVVLRGIVAIGVARLDRAQRLLARVLCFSIGRRGPLDPRVRVRLELEPRDAESAGEDWAALLDLLNHHQPLMLEIVQVEPAAPSGLPGLELLIMDED